MGMAAFLVFVLVFALAAIYAAIVLYVYSRQTQLLYQPDATSRTLSVTPLSIGIAYEDVRIPTSDGVTLHAWLVPADTEQPLVLFCHGNAGSIADRLDTVRLLHQLGLNLLIFDYRGYGRSTGRPSEGGTYRDAEAAWRYLTEGLGYAPDEIVLFGRSLGAAIAAHLAKDVRPAALIVEAAFSSLPDVAAHHFWYLPVRQLTRFRYSTVDYVRSVDAPTLVIHSSEDSLVPIEQGRKIFDQAKGPKRFLLILGRHGEGALASGTRYSEGVRRFLSWALGTAPAPAPEGVADP
jgi:hypothetical protein